ncbi:MAG: GDSL-type esterase/lipase family protein [bacterium]|nr:GDSL-type esterase/lipase family protein [bacterium]
MLARSLSCVLGLAAFAPAQARWLDLEGDTARQVTVHRDPRHYLGHPTTVLLADGRTMLCVHPKGHGRGPIVLQRSDDAGLTWSKPLPVPENWATSKETPTIHRLTDPAGKERLVLFSGLYPIRSSISEDNGATWTPLAPIGDFGGIVAMSSVVRLKNGEYAAFFHDDGRFFRKGGKRSHFTVYQTRSRDGGLTWGEPTIVVASKTLHPCEPGVIRSPDGNRIAMLLRENSRKFPSQICFSDDEANRWSPMRPMPITIGGDRHVGAYAPDGRLLISFRDMAKGSPTRGDWVAWVGTFADLITGSEGQYRVRLSRNWRGTDCAYPGVEVLADGTFVVTTYGHWEPGQRPFIRSVRVRLEELDALANEPAPKFERVAGTVHPTRRLAKWWVDRVAANARKAKQGGYEVVFVGDSITQGWGGPGRKVWAELFEPRRAINLGLSGDRTQNVLWRLDSGLTDSLAKDARVAVVMIGTNNATHGECSPAEIAKGVEAVVDRLLTGLPNAKVLLLAIFPRGPRNGAPAKRCVASNELLAERYAATDRVVYRDIGESFVKRGETIDKKIMPDRLHLSPAGYRLWGEAIVGEIDALLR